MFSGWGCIDSLAVPHVRHLDTDCMFPVVFVLHEDIVSPVLDFLVVTQTAGDKRHSRRPTPLRNSRRDAGFEPRLNPSQ